MATIKEIIQDAVQSVLHIDRDEIPEDIRDLCLSVVNVQGRLIYDSWPWDNSKVDEFVAPDSDSDGIIEFDSTVDIIRAIRSVGNENTSVAIFAQDDVLAAINGEEVTSDHFKHLSDSSDGNRRIMVDTANASNAYKVLALKRFVPYQALETTDEDYDAARDYKLVPFIIDKAEPALRAFLEDSLRAYNDMPVFNQGAARLAVAITRETQLQQREHRINPRYPMFQEAEDWRDLW